MKWLHVVTSQPGTELSSLSSTSAKEIVGTCWFNCGKWLQMSSRKYILPTKSYNCTELGCESEYWSVGLTFGPNCCYMFVSLLHLRHSYELEQLPKSSGNRSRRKPFCKGKSSTAPGWPSSRLNSISTSTNIWSWTRRIHLRNPTSCSTIPTNWTRMARGDQRKGTALWNVYPEPLNCRLLHLIAQHYGILY